MSKCRNCKIEVSDITEYCPLCHNVLEVTDDCKDTYPDVKKKARKLSFTLRLLLFLWILTSAITGYINYQTLEINPRPWSIVVVLSTFYPLYLIFMIARDKGYLHRIFTGFIGANIIVVLIDVVTGFRGWSVNFLIPGTLLLIDLVLIILMMVNHRNWQSYMIYQLLIIFIGIVPLILIKTGVVTRPILSEVAFMSAVLVFLGTLIIGGQEAIAELKRRFHVN